MKILIAAVAVSITAHAATTSMDSARGEKLFQTLGCVQCHSINGLGGKRGPDLGRGIDRNFTPATLAATMWNHAPAMWAAMKEKDLPAGVLNDQGAADLFAYFYSAHFFDKPGDAARGKQAFAAKHCAECHALTQAKLPANDPIALVNDMWNHASTMKDEFAKRNFRWPDLTSQDLTDIQVYLRNLPSQASAPSNVRIDSTGGEVLFQSKGCVECHAGKGSGKIDLAPRLKHATLTDIAAAMWNHEPLMNKARKAAPPHLELDEMQHLIGYLWAREYFEDSGDASRGAHIFQGKQCTVCHGTGANGAPKFPTSDRTFSGAAMVSALWHHGPSMLSQMKVTRIAWPRFEGSQMADVIAYLNSASSKQNASPPKKP
jgi:mono/diheme cytochrome c family protein